MADDLVADLDKFLSRVGRIRIWYGDSCCTAWSAPLNGDTGFPITNSKDVALGVGSPTGRRNILDSNQKKCTSPIVLENLLAADA